MLDMEVDVPAPVGLQSVGRQRRGLFDGERGIGQTHRPFPTFPHKLQTIARGVNLHRTRRREHTLCR